MYTQVLRVLESTDIGATNISSVNCGLDPSLVPTIARALDQYNRHLSFLAGDNQKSLKMIRSFSLLQPDQVTGPQPQAGSSNSSSNAKPKFSKFVNRYYHDPQFHRSVHAESVLWEFLAGTKQS